MEKGVHWCAKANRGWATEKTRPDLVEVRLHLGVEQVLDAQDVLEPKLENAASSAAQRPRCHVRRLGVTLCD